MTENDYASHIFTSLVQWISIWRAPRFTTHLPVVRQTKLFFVTVAKVNDDIKLINEKMKLYVFNWREIWGSCCQGSCCTSRRARCVATAVCGCALFC